MSASARWTFARRQLGWVASNSAAATLPTRFMPWRSQTETTCSKSAVIGNRSGRSPAVRGGGSDAIGSRASAAIPSWEAWSQEVATERSRGILGSDRIRSLAIRILSYIAVLLAVTLLAAVAGYALLSAWTWPPGPTAEGIVDPPAPENLELTFGGFPTWPEARGARAVEAQAGRGGSAGLPERSGERSVTVKIADLAADVAALDVAVLAADGQPLERLSLAPEATGPIAELEFSGLPAGPLSVVLLAPDAPARTRWLTATALADGETAAKLHATLRHVPLEIGFAPSLPGSADAARWRAVTPRLSRPDAPDWLAPRGAAPTQMVDRASGSANWSLGPLGVGRYRLDFDGFVAAADAALEFEVRADAAPASLRIEGEVPGPAVPASAPDTAGANGLPGRGPGPRNGAD